MERLQQVAKYFMLGQYTNHPCIDEISQSIVVLVLPAFPLQRCKQSDILLRCGDFFPLLQLIFWVIQCPFSRRLYFVPDYFGDNILGSDTMPGMSLQRAIDLDQDTLYNITMKAARPAWPTADSNLTKHKQLYN